MKSKVFAVTMRTSFKENMFDKIDRLLEAVDLKKSIKERDLVAVKLHFGEKGNTAYIRPIYLRRVVDAVKALKAQPFLTDANTLYVGTRSNAARHLITAIENGFDYSVVGAPLTIADGLKGASVAEVDINLPNVKTAYIGRDVVDADALISVAHFKLHELSGFGGAIKNVGMGAASRRGKMDQHSGISPKVKNSKCIGCGDCVAHCAHKAISLKKINNKKKAKIDPEKCVGCAECILVCGQKAIQVQWAAKVPDFMKKMAEYTAACLKGKEMKSFFINFLTQISPACDCFGHADAPLVRDIGILASRDPIAIDQASADLVNQEPALAGTCLNSCTAPGEDKFRGVYPKIDWEIQLDHGQEIGLGTRDYQLVWLPDKT
jgi:uncharacterized Fe-S center protein